MAAPRRGFSLVELLVVIGVVGVLVGLLLPAVQRVRASAVRTACQNNLKQVGVALYAYESARGRFPPEGSPAPPPGGGFAPNPNQLLSWQALILPQVEQSELWEAAVRACRDDVLPFHNPPHAGYATVVPLYVCPADPRLRSPLRYPSGDEAAFTSYLGVEGYVDSARVRYLPGMLGVQLSPGARVAQVTDGTSQTVMVGERPPPASLQAGRWYARVADAAAVPNPGPDEAMPAETPKPATEVECRLAGTRYGPGVVENPCDRYHFWSLHPAGANWLFADGSVRYLPYTARDLIPALATRAGGEVVSLE
ncbi:MAG: prepilin-type cleavage/methylation domain-containing protein [Isosphaera sp.]|nr:prepilin-type cleavage/methylation domain-containing protein [Isosphaera sp.]